MRSITVKMIFGFCAVTLTLCAQDLGFDAFQRHVQVHGFLSQGFALSGQNNYLTMSTNGGTMALTDAGATLSTNVTDKFRVGVQFYVRDIGRLGQWRPTIDWAQGDYRLNHWLGIRAGKVKTVVGLRNDTQDLDFLHTFAIMPQSIYPLDTRSATIAHTGADLYGRMPVKHLGALSYTVYGGRRNDDLRGGWPYVINEQWNDQIQLKRYSGRQVGADLRWELPVTGLMVGSSYITESLSGTGRLLELNDLGKPTGSSSPYSEHSNKLFTSQFYAEYVRGDLRLASEYRRAYRDERIFNGEFPVVTDTRGWYASASYRLSQRFEVGGYHSRLVSDWAADHAAPDNHVYDGVGTLRIDVSRHWTIKLEGHRMYGYGGRTPAGFYGTDNPNGFQPVTNLFVIRTGYNF